MGEQEYNKVFAENLKQYLKINNMSQADLAKRLGVSGQAVSNWCSAAKSPRMDKVDMMCRIFGCKRSDLVEERKERQKPTLRKDEIDLLKLYNLLTDEAKEKVLEYAETLGYKDKNLRKRSLLSNSAS